MAHLRILDADSPASQSSHYCLSAVLEGPLKGRRQDLVARLKAKGVGTSIYYPQPVPRMTYYRRKFGYQAGAYPQAEAISDCSIALPVGPHLGPGDLDYLVQSFKEAVKEIK